MHWPNSGLADQGTTLVSEGKLSLLASRTGAIALLDRLGLRGPLSSAVRLASSGEERSRWRTIRQDYLSCRDMLRRISKDLPETNPKAIAWMIVSLPTVSGLKLEGVMALGARMA